MKGKLKRKPNGVCENWIKKSGKREGCDLGVKGKMVRRGFEMD